MLSYVLLALAATAVLLVLSDVSGSRAGAAVALRPTASTPSAAQAVATAPPFRVAAWSRGDLASLGHAVAATAIAEVDLDWWHQRADGTLVPELVHPAYVTQAHRDHLKIFATITNRRNDVAPFEPAIAEAILSTAKTRASSVARLVALCRQRGYDGIDLDWESLRAADRSRLTAYVAVLSQQLHKAGKKLSMALYAKSKDVPAGPEGPAMAAEDYRALGRVLDECKLMTYAQHDGYTAPGPISSPAYETAVLSYAERLIPAAKLWLGVPFFSLDWAGSHLYRYLLRSQVQALIRTYHPTLVRSPSGKVVFHYTDALGRYHTVYFEDRLTMARTMSYALTRKPRLAGIAIWVMGGEDYGYWTVIGQALAHHS